MRKKRENKVKNKVTKSMDKVILSPKENALLLNSKKSMK